jgi:hypothetical protein
LYVLCVQLKEANRSIATGLSACKKQRKLVNKPMPFFYSGRIIQPKISQFLSGRIMPDDVAVSEESKTQAVIERSKEIYLYSSSWLGGEFYSVF